MLLTYTQINTNTLVVMDINIHFHINNNYISEISTESLKIFSNRIEYFRTHISLRFIVTAIINTISSPGPMKAVTPSLQYRSAAIAPTLQLLQVLLRKVTRKSIVSPYFCWTLVNARFTAGPDRGSANEYRVSFTSIVAILATNLAAIVRLAKHTSAPRIKARPMFLMFRPVSTQKWSWKSNNALLYRRKWCNLTVCLNKPNC